jgi:pimeloyl-ACP methyl ester carboxylesterase
MSSTDPQNVLADRRSSSRTCPRRSTAQPAGREGLAGPARFVLAPGHAGGLQGVYDCIKAFSETDQTDDLRKLTVPASSSTARTTRSCRSAPRRGPPQIAPQAQLKVYPGAPHGLCSTHKDKVNADLLEFLRS